MRRILVSISENRDYGDSSTLVNADVVERIKQQVQGEKKN